MRWMDEWARESELGKPRTRNYQDSERREEREGSKKTRESTAQSDQVRFLTVAVPKAFYGVGTEYVA